MYYFKHYLMLLIFCHYNVYKFIVFINYNDERKHLKIL